MELNLYILQGYLQKDIGNLHPTIEILENIPIRYRNGSINDGIKSLYFTRMSTKRYWELAPHNKNPKKYPNIVEISELRL